MSVRNGPGEGTWSVFAQQVVEQRDTAETKLSDLRAWALSRITYCQEIEAHYAEPRPDIPLEPVIRRQERRTLEAVVKMIDAKAEP